MLMPSAAPVPITDLQELGPLPPGYQPLQAQLAHCSWICQGTLVCRPLWRRVQGQRVKKGPYYLWTSKVKGKTVCLALSRTQYRLLAQAIKNYRHVQKTLDRMQTLTMKTILRKVPGVQRRK